MLPGILSRLYLSASCEEPLRPSIPQREGTMDRRTFLAVTFTGSLIPATAIDTGRYRKHDLTAPYHGDVFECRGCCGASAHERPN